MNEIDQQGEIANIKSMLLVYMSQLEEIKKQQEYNQHQEELAYQSHLHEQELEAQRIQFEEDLEREAAA